MRRGAGPSFGAGSREGSHYSAKQVAGHSVVHAGSISVWLDVYRLGSVPGGVDW